MALLAALQFLTRIPIRLRREPALEPTVAWFPLAGALIGVTVGGCAAGVWHIAPPTVAGAVAVVVGVLITGAFHEDGLGADYGRGTTRTRAAAGAIGGMAVTVAAVGWWAAPLAGMALLAMLGTGTLARRKIGGVSGDVLGATEQVAECLCLVVISGVAMHHRLWWV